MLVAANGQERTLKQHEELLESSGWKLLGVSQSSYFDGGFQYVEAAPI